jgi:hypothetical protein
VAASADSRGKKCNYEGEKTTEGVGFEPTVSYPTLDFESSALNRTQPPFPQGGIIRCATRFAICSDGL